MALKCSLIRAANCIVQNETADPFSDTIKLHQSESHFLGKVKLWQVKPRDVFTQPVGCHLTLQCITLIIKDLHKQL